MDDHSLSIITEFIVKGLNSEDSLIREGASSLANNVCIFIPKVSSDPVLELISSITSSIQSEKDGEIAFRLLSALSHILYLSTNDVKELFFSFQTDLIIKQFINIQPTHFQASPSSSSKVIEISKELISMLEVNLSK